MSLIFPFPPSHPPPSHPPTLPPSLPPRTLHLWDFKSAYLSSDITLSAPSKQKLALVKRNAYMSTYVYISFWANKFKVGGRGFPFFSGEFLKIHNDLTKPASKANEKPEPSLVLCNFWLSKQIFRVTDPYPLKDYHSTTSIAFQSESPTSTPKLAS